MASNRQRSEVLVRALGAIVEADRAEIERVFTDDVRMWSPEIAASSRDELITALQRRDDAFSDIVLDATPLDVSGDHACVEWTVAMVHSGPIGLADGSTIEPTGLQLELNGVTVAEFDGDAICSLRQYWNMHSLLDQLGELHP